VKPSLSCNNYRVTLLNYQNFWGDAEKSELLASFIQPYVTDPAGFEARRVDSYGDIIEPERVIVRAGPDRVTRQNATITLNGQASLFAENYSWKVVSPPPGSAVTLSSPGTMKTEFSADLDGDYTLQLTASANTGGDLSDTLVVKVDDDLATAPRDLMFYNDISGLLTTSCNSCHDGSEPGIPVWWLDDTSQPMGIPANDSEPPSLGFYEQVMAGVNFEDVEDSLLLKKPTGRHYFGDQRPGFDTSFALGSVSRASYDLFVNWISEGAACGGTATQCVR